MLKSKEIKVNYLCATNCYSTLDASNLLNILNSKNYKAH